MERGGLRRGKERREEKRRGGDPLLFRCTPSPEPSIRKV